MRASEFSSRTINTAVPDRDVTSVANIKSRRGDKKTGSSLVFTITILLKTLDFSK